MDRNSFAFETVLILGLCYLAVLASSGDKKVSYTVGQGLFNPEQKIWNFWKIFLVWVKRLGAIKDLRSTLLTHFKGIYDASVQREMNQASKFILVTLY